MSAVELVLLVLAVLCFAGAVVNVPVRYSLVAAGLLLWCLAVSLLPRLA